MEESAAVRDSEYSDTVFRLGAHSQLAQQTTRAGLELGGWWRLDNTDDLQRELATKESEAALLARAYDRWGPGFCDRLRGDFVIVVWDPRNRELCIGRDPFGTASVFYHHSSKSLHYSSSLDDLLSQPGVPCEPNPMGVAISMVFLKDGERSTTLYRDISQIPPGHYLTVKQGKVEVREYWGFEQIKDLRYPSDEAYVDEFLQRLKIVVERRIAPAQRVGITLSGGLDSGAIAVTAATLLAQNDQTLSAFTSVPAYEFDEAATQGGIGDEGPLAAATAASSTAIEHTLVDAREVSPLQGIREANRILGHPLVAVGNCYWLLSIYQRMQAAGIDTVLSGQYGNATISWQGNRNVVLGSLLRSGKLSEFRRQFQALRKAHDLSTAQALKRLIGAPLAPLSLVTWRQQELAGLTPWEASSPLNSQLAQSLSLRDFMAANGAFGATPLNLRYREYLLPLGRFSGSAVGADLASHFGLTFSDPTTDRDLIEFCFGIPEEQFIRPGKQRRLIRRAMRGQLPAEVLDNNRIGLQSADLIMRIRQHQGEIADALGQARSSALSCKYLDIDRMQVAFDNSLTQKDFHTSLQASRILLKGLQTADFLRRFE